MIDKLVFLEGKTATTEFEIKADNIMLTTNGTFMTGGIVENMAQTCAARIGYINKYLESKSVKIGVIGAVKNLIINSLPKIGDVLTTTVEETFNGMLNMTLLNAKIECNGEVIAEGEIKVALTNNDSK